MGILGISEAAVMRTTLAVLFAALLFATTSAGPLPADSPPLASASHQENALSLAHEVEDPTVRAGADPSPSVQLPTHPETAPNVQYNWARETSKRQKSVFTHNQPHKGIVSKSYYDNDDPVSRYCTQLSLKQTDVEKELQKNTLDKAERARMMGAPEVLQLGKNFIRLIGAKKVLDIGTFTGFSAVAWATALPADGRVLTMDISHEALNAHGKPVIDRYPEVADKIDFRLGKGLDVLDELVANGESGTWDMAFIDASDKQNNWNYYCKCKQLLRSGGVILVDNALAGGRVATEPEGNERLDAIRACNERIFEDEETDSILLNLGDGTHVAFKH